MFDQAEAILRVGVEKNALRAHAWIKAAAPSVVGRLRGLVDPIRRSGALRAALSGVAVMPALALNLEPGRPTCETCVRARAALLLTGAGRSVLRHATSYYS